MKALSRRHTWMLVGAGSTMLASAAVSGALEGGWRALREEEPPIDADARDTTLGKALVWAVVSGALVSLTQVLARRVAAHGWKSVTGKSPPRKRSRQPR